MTENILEVRDLVKHYPVTRGVVFKKTIGHVKAVDGVSFDLQARRDPRRGRRVRLRQVDARPGPDEPGEADRAAACIYKGQDISKLSGRRCGGCAGRSSWSCRTRTPR